MKIIITVRTWWPWSYFKRRNVKKVGRDGNFLFTGKAASAVQITNLLLRLNVTLYSWWAILSVTVLYVGATTTVRHLFAGAGQTATHRVALTAFQQADCTDDVVLIIWLGRLHRRLRMQVDEFCRSITTMMLFGLYGRLLFVFLIWIHSIYTANYWQFYQQVRMYGSFGNCRHALGGLSGSRRTQQRAAGRRTHDRHFKSMTTDVISEIRHRQSVDAYLYL